MAGVLPEEEVSDEIAAKVVLEPPSPSISVEQLRALKAQLRHLIPAIHEASSHCLR